MILIIIGMILIIKAFKEEIKRVPVPWHEMDMKGHRRYTQDDHIKTLQGGSYLQTQGEETISAGVLIFDIQPLEWW